VKVLAPLLGLVLAAGCAHAPSRGPKLETVNAEGWSPLDRADPPGTRRRALAEAQRAAVEKATGVEVSARTQVAQAINVEQKITARTQGTIRSYEVLGESESDGFLKIRIRAAVEVGPPALTEARPEPPPGDPKVAVILNGPHAEKAAAGVRKALLARGFTVIEGGDADLTVSGEVTLAPLGIVGEFNSSRARVSLQARRSKGGEILAESSREVSAIDPAASIAEEKSSETAGLLGAEILARDVASRLADK